jgi:flagellar biosynthesis protein FlhG
VSDLLQLVDKRLRGRCLLANVDQAEGLRRMLAGPKPRVFTFLSALKDNEKSEMLVNLVSVARQGQQILMVDARSSSDIVRGSMRAASTPCWMWRNNSVQCTRQ